MKNNRGYLLTEVLVAGAITAVAAVVFMGVNSSFNSFVRQTRVKTAVAMLRANALAQLRNPQALQNTVSDTVNGFSCVSSLSTCPTFVGSTAPNGSPFELLDAHSNIVVPKWSTTSTKGFDLSGNPCDNFGTDICPLQLNIGWQPLCVTGTCPVSPLLTQFKFVGTFTYRPGTVTTTQINLDPYHFTLLESIAIGGVATCSPTATSPTAHGAGTLADPYLLCTAKQVNAIGATAGLMASNFRVVANIDMSTITGHVAIGSAAAPFTGSFDGGNFAISKLKLGGRTAAGPLGFFAGIDPGATLSNIVLQNPSVIALNTVGGLVGRMRGGSITNCSVQRTSGRVGIGADSSMTATMVGGMVGNMSGGTITRSSVVNMNVGAATCGCFSVGIQAGGFVGAMSAGNITKSYISGGDVDHGDFANNSGEGGFVGLLSGGTIAESYASPKNLGGSGGGTDTNLGGFAGTITGGVIADSYVLDTKIGANSLSFTNIGGFVGNISGAAQVTRAFTAAKSITSSGTNKGNFVGLGVAGPTYTASLWDSTHLTLASGIGSGPLTNVTAAVNTGGNGLQSRNTFVNAPNTWTNMDANPTGACAAGNLWHAPNSAPPLLCWQ